MNVSAFFTIVKITSYINTDLMKITISIQILLWEASELFTIIINCKEEY
jgi:hypothetical protein